ncbi:MAG: cytochrome c3 family protein, partial [Planctomycetota bacterium]
MTFKRVSLLSCLAFPGIAMAGLTGSSHDFSGAGWNTKGACAPCHTPHGGAEAQPAPLWSHVVTQADFTLYDSPTMQGTAEQPRAESKLCLSCHDGTVALGAFGDNTDSTYIGGDAHLGISMADDHPISFPWQHQSQPASCMHCHQMQPVPRLVSELPFFDGYIECSTCHDVHNGSGYPKMLRKP